MKETLLLIVGYFLLVFFAVFLTALGFRLALLIVNNIMGVLA